MKELYNNRPIKGTNMSIPKPYTFDRVTRIVISAVIISAIIYLLIITRAALLPFFIAWLIAYLINPIILLTQRILRLKSKIIAVFIVLMLALSLLIGMVWFFIPKFIVELQKVVALLNQYLLDNKFEDILPAHLNEQISIFFKESEFLKSLSANDASMLIRKTFVIVWGVISESFALIVALVSTFVAFLYLIFILKDYENITQGAINLIPPKYKHKAMVIVDDVESGMNRYYRGQATVALIVGVLLAIGFHIVSLPMGIVLGLFIGMLNLVPYMQIIGVIPMIILSLLQSAEGGDNFFVTFGLSMMVLGVVQFIQDAFIVPRIMGKVTGLNPAIILLSLSVWGVLLGVIGMIIALPFTTILLSYYKRFILNKEDFDSMTTIESLAEEKDDEKEIEIETKNT